MDWSKMKTANRLRSFRHRRHCLRRIEIFLERFDLLIASRAGVVDEAMERALKAVALSLGLGPKGGTEVSVETFLREVDRVKHRVESAMTMTDQDVH